jgi:hypothetical protein
MTDMVRLLKDSYSSKREGFKGTVPPALHKFVGTGEAQIRHIAAGLLDPGKLCPHVLTPVPLPDPRFLKCEVFKPFPCRDGSFPSVCKLSGVHAGHKTIFARTWGRDLEVWSKLSPHIPSKWTWHTADPISVPLCSVFPIVSALFFLLRHRVCSLSTPGRFNMLEEAPRNQTYNVQLICQIVAWADWLAAGFVPLSPVESQYAS